MKTLTDKAGKEKTFSKVYEDAMSNVSGSLGRYELLEAYVDNLTDDELVEWATDENGEFTSR